jgi:putative aldouronate transport system substrate-binding protein
MKKRTFGLAAAIIALSASVLSGCSDDSKQGAVPGASSQASPKAPAKLSVLTMDQGRVWKADNPAILELQKKTNTVLNVQLVPGGDYANKYSVLASSNDLADISKTNGFDFQKYADSGVYMEISKLLDEYGPNLKSKLSKDAWDMVKYKGKTFAIPYENTPGKIVPIIRTDWLESLGLKQPTTLEEYKEVLMKFTFNDPDKNGKQDTFGIGSGGDGAWETDFMMIFGAFGAFPFQHEIKDNKVIPMVISPEYKQAIEYIKGLWDAKVMDPDFFVIKLDAAQQKMAQGKIGTVTGWWSVAPQGLYRALKMTEIVPGAKMEPFAKLVTGPTGKSALRSMGNIAGSIQISANAKDPAAAIKLLDYMATDEGWELARYGIKGVHYNTIEDGFLPEGQKAFDEKWLDPLSQIVLRVDLFVKASASGKSDQQKLEYKYMKAALDYPLFQDAFYGLPQTEEQKTLGSDLNQFEKDMFIKFVTGKEPLSNWETYVAEWKKKGGQKILESRVAKYNELKGTKVVPSL